MMKPYPSYKDSGVEWIGKIPGSWEVKKLKYTSDISPSNVDKNIYPEEIQIRLCNYTDVYYNEFITPSLEFKKGSCNQNEFDKFRLRQDDIIITKDSETPDDIGIPTLSTYDFDNVVCGYHLTLIRPKEIVGRYLFRFIQSDRIRKYFEINSDGVTRFGLGKPTIENMYVPLPPTLAQEHIVSYLDHKIHKIDELITITEKKIELLKKKRTALINHCVTKGLNPDVEMKDSGVEWIGEIPGHWETIALKYISRGNVDALGNDTSPDYELDYIEINDVSSTGIISEPTHYEFSKSPSRCRRIVRKNDTILSTVRTYLKAIGFIEEDVSDLICSTGFCVITPTEIVVPRYLFHLVRTEWFVSNVISNSEGVSYPAIQADKLMNSKVILPLKSEQFQIVSYLDEQTQKIDSTNEIETKRIELLKEYRQSLISNVVTGKIDVRDEVAI